MLNRRRSRNRSPRTVLALAGLVFAGFVTAAQATDDGTRIFAHPEWAKWFADQIQPNGQPGVDGHGVSCCNQADGHILDDNDVRIVDGDYEVHTPEVGWLRFPNNGEGQSGNTVLGYVRNPTGHAVAWYTDWGRPLCFAPGTGA